MTVIGGLLPWWKKSKGSFVTAWSKLAREVGCCDRGREVNHVICGWASRGPC